MSIYTELGYSNRTDYLNNLSDDFGVERETIYQLASILGKSEDFDGLINALEDHDQDNFLYNI